MGEAEEPADASVDELLGFPAVTESTSKGDAAVEGSADDVDIVPAVPGSGSSTATGSTLSFGSSRSSRRAGAILDGGDVPEHDMSLPEEVVVTDIGCGAHFQLRCQVDLKKLSFMARNAEYNPRRMNSVTLRLLDPKITAMVRASGSVNVAVARVGCEEMQRGARKVARILQKCDHPSATCENFRFINFRAQANLAFPVRLEALASKWHRHTLYEPEVSPSCYFYLPRPRCTLSVNASGKVSIVGATTYEEAREAMRITYPIFREFVR
mmetsp:Transcript_43291/g.128231  ORF Transcript_43291/g.128231 Transcript_43291/m.128231 type:complete len:268 (-) Transcript_43291:31-834(-)